MDLSATDVENKEFSEALAKQGAETTSTWSTPQQFKALIVQDLATWGKVVKTSGAKID